MSTCLLALCLSLSHHTAPHPPADRWIGEDKWKHYFVSFVVTSLAASGARAAGAGRSGSLYVGAGAGVAAGAYKEMRDRHTPGATPSLRDFAWDLAGVGTGVVVAAQAR
ncbi:MAG: putative periplasmic lipoprotein [Gemmatimonadetes bacterium]|nr:putative periplasmic lipoprotein [Gemmatimonadota bacterium]